MVYYATMFWSMTYSLWTVIDFCVFFFKQKTAYEMRISDWSSDVCSSDLPMLLIDDEADNASINIKYGKDEVSRINGQIRELLGLFNRSCYVGYTATPFANIFIDPDSEDEVGKQDLFPRHFIIGLDAPTNYFGPRKVFIDGMPDDVPPRSLRYITDKQDVLPRKPRIKHTEK